MSVLPQQLSFSSRVSICSSTLLFLNTKLSHLSLHTQPITHKTTLIRMGGGPRTFPGGVSKWQWKRMQAKKAKQLLKARLSRERHIYEMRKRAELKAAVSELERPWELVERAPTLFSVRTDDQLRVLADRFQQPGGFDMWTERDGPQLFDTADGLPSGRFFPKGVVHSVKPYGRISQSQESDDSSGLDAQLKMQKSNRKSSSRKLRGGQSSEREGADRDLFSTQDGSFVESSPSRTSFELSSMGEHNASKIIGKMRKNGNTRRSSDVNSSRLGSNRVGFARKLSEENPTMRKSSSRRKNVLKVKESNSEVYDLNLQQDGSYGFGGNRR